MSFDTDDEQWYPTYIAIVPAVPALVISLENKDTHNAALVAQDEKLHQLPAGHASKLYAHDGAHQSAVESLDVALRQEIARLHSKHDGLSEAQVSMLEELEAKLRDEMMSQGEQLDEHLGMHQAALQAIDDKLKARIGRVYAAHGDLRDTHNTALEAMESKFHHLLAGHGFKLGAHAGAHQSAMKAFDIDLCEEIARLHSKHDCHLEALASMLELLEAKLRDEIASQGEETVVEDVAGARSATIVTTHGAPLPSRDGDGTHDTDQDGESVICMDVHTALSLLMCNYDWECILGMHEVTFNMVAASLSRYELGSFANCSRWLRSEERRRRIA